MIQKQAVAHVPLEQSAKGYHSQLFSVPKKEEGGDKTYNQFKEVEFPCGNSAMEVSPLGLYQDHKANSDCPQDSGPEDDHIRI